jgi:hypothetical protein
VTTLTPDAEVTDALFVVATWRCRIRLHDGPRFVRSAKAPRMVGMGRKGGATYCMQGRRDSVARVAAGSACCPSYSLSLAPSPTRPRRLLTRGVDALVQPPSLSRDAPLVSRAMPPTHELASELLLDRCGTPFNQTIQTSPCATLHSRDTSPRRPHLHTEHCRTQRERNLRRHARDVNIYTRPGRLVHPWGCRRACAARAG